MNKIDDHWTICFGLVPVTAVYAYAYACVCACACIFVDAPDLDVCSPFSLWERGHVISNQ